MGMALKQPFRSPAEGEFLFEIDETPLEETLTSFGGLALFLRAARSLGGGECLDDFDVLREDRGRAAMLGYEPPSPEAARKFLYPFHDESKIAEAQQKQLEWQRAGIIPGESEAWVGLAAVNRDIVSELGRRTAEQTVATVDSDATIIVSHNRKAQASYQGTRGYQRLSATRR